MNNEEEAMFNKKTFITLVLATLVTLGVSAQATGFVSMEAGWLPDTSIMVWKPVYSTLDTENVLYVNLAARLPILKYGFVEGSINTILLLSDVNATGNFLPFYGNPLVDDYRVGAGLVFGPFTIGARHSCIHPVAPVGVSLLSSVYTGSGFTEAYIKLEYKF